MSNSVRRANRPIIDNNGIAKGILKEVSLGTGFRREKIGRDIEETEFQRYEFCFDIEGITGSPVEIKLFTGTIINDEPSNILGKTRGKKQQTKIYNRFTTTCIALGLLNDKELSTVSDKQMLDIEQKLSKIKNAKVTCKVGKNADNFFIIDPTTIQLEG